MLYNGWVYNMANNFSISLLGEGQLPAVKTALYTVPAATKAVIKTITLVNDGATPVTINLYLKRAGSTSRKIIPKNMSFAAGYTLETDEEYTLGTGDSIEGECSSAAQVDYTINGVQET